MGTLKVDNISNQEDNGPVIFNHGIIADGSQIILKPVPISFDPTNLEQQVSRSTNITIGFNQTMQLTTAAGVGTIYIREGSNSGTISTYFEIGTSTEISMVGSVLTINPADDLDYATTYFVTLPGVGIANTLGGYIDAIDSYQFTTEDYVFDITGGDASQVVADPASPTGFYKYNIFTSSGPATFNAPSSVAVDFSYVLVGGGGGGGGGGPSSGGGGGGGGGGVVKNYNSTNLPGGNYTVTIGSGGSGTFDNPNGINGGPPNPNAPYSVVCTNGQNSSFGPTPVGTIVAYGGGRGGHYQYSGNPGPSYYRPANPVAGNYNGQPGGSGGGGSAVESSVPGYDPTPGPSNIASGGNGFAYPSPNQQGYPGGQTSRYISPTYSPTTLGGAGGGGAGSPGGSLYLAPGTPGPVPWHLAGGGGGSSTPNPTFPGPGLAFLNFFPIDFINTVGSSCQLAGGGGGAVGPVYPTSYPFNPTYWTPYTTTNPGGGGAGRGRFASNPTQPAPSRGSGPFFATAGMENTGGGGGGGYAPGGDPGPYPVPAPGNWYGLPGGSGIAMFRYAHPGN